MSTSSITIEITFLDVIQRDAASDLFARSGGWSPIVDGEPNPVNAEEFGVQMLAKYLRQQVNDQANRDAKIAAAQTVIDLLDGVTVTTPLEQTPLPPFTALAY
mgnify:CR=1 FL=1